MSAGQAGDEATAAVLAAAVDAGPAAILVADSEGRLVAANATASDLLGYTRVELLELRVAEITPVPAAAEAMFEELVRAGAQNGLTPVRTRDGETILVRYAAKGVGDGLYVSFILPSRILPRDTTAQQEAARRPRSRDRSALSTRESEILALLAEGLENDEIGRSLHLAPDTVKAHVSKILQKLGARSRTHAVALGFRSGLIG